MWVRETIRLSTLLTTACILVQMVPELESLGQHIALLEARQMAILKAQLFAPEYDAALFSEGYLPDISTLPGSHSDIPNLEALMDSGSPSAVSDDWLDTLLKQIQSANPA